MTKLKEFLDEIIRRGGMNWFCFNYIIVLSFSYFQTGHMLEKGTTSGPPQPGSPNSNVTTLQPTKPNAEPIVSNDITTQQPGPPPPPPSKRHHLNKHKHHHRNW